MNLNLKGQNEFIYELRIRNFKIARLVQQINNLKLSN